MLFRLAIVIFPVIVFGAGCVTVAPWERGNLAHHSMDKKSAAAACSDDFMRHTFDVREGATGGSGHAGGGCGCN
ncbi:MAG: DUF4266 domain-containing protein [Myxococcota bacterium]|nr:DUF4266 domain-containing protein [Myxococcota bacterium]